MKRKIMKITASILSCMLMVCVVLGSYAETTDETILTDNGSAIQEETAEPVEVSDNIAEPETSDGGEAAEEAMESPVVENTEASDTADQTESADDNSADTRIPENTEPAADNTEATETADVNEQIEEPSKADDSEMNPESVEIQESGDEKAEENTAEPEEKNEDTDTQVTDVTEEDEAEDEKTDDAEDLFPNETDENGLVELDDEDHGYVDPDIIPESIANITPEMRFEGITQLYINSEVSGVACEDEKAYHYIHSEYARTVVLTLYTGSDIQVQINDKSVLFESATDGDGNDCLVYQTGIRAGDTYISLSGQSVSYRLKASQPVTDEEETEETPETEETAETTGEEGEGEETAEVPADESAAEPDDESTEEHVDEQVEAETPVETTDEAGDAPEEPEAAADEQPAEPEPERHIEIHCSIEGKKQVYTNSYVKLTAELFGYEDVEYTVQWYYSPDQGATQIPIPGANSLKYIYQINDENLNYIWSVEVTPVDG